MLMETYTKDNGKTVMPKEKVFIYTATVLSMTATGRTIYNKESAKKPGQMALLIKVIMSKEKRRVKVNSIGVMGLISRVTFIAIILMEKAYINGLMVVSITVTG